MLLNAYSLYDQKALTYSPPFYCAAHGQAVRMVMELVSDPSTICGRHPADFSLLCVGQFDDTAGLLLPTQHREHIADAVSLSPKRQPDFFANPPVTNGEVTNG
ncbi:nonstructural protein [Blackfly microvirus SF02]|uniref:Nonstructural protein n=1 Tax=Blackfly microvirus SF02 TaxID=2576452 RepID=A0A4P8PPM7_9VIRU|nr:nonstructural protein [Blackfly microvirus SF02]